MEKKKAMKWVEALRSGEYEQGRGRLRVTDNAGDSFCCLGVACEIGLATQDPMTQFVRTDFLSSLEQRRLARWNDGEDVNGQPIKRWSFKKIANWIEKNYKLL